MCGFWDTLKNKKKTYIVLTLPQDFCWSPGDQAYIIWFLRILRNKRNLVVSLVHMQKALDTLVSKMVTSVTKNQFLCDIIFDVLHDLVPLLKAMLLKVAKIQQLS